MKKCNRFVSFVTEIALSVLWTLSLSAAEVDVQMAKLAVDSWLGDDLTKVDAQFTTREIADAKSYTNEEARETGPGFPGSGFRTRNFGLRIPESFYIFALLSQWIATNTSPLPCDSFPFRHT